MAAKETVITTVTMTDGRIVDFPGKRRLLKAPIFTPEGVSVRFDFVNGETRLFSPRADLVSRFTAHGIEQKIGDETAGINDLDDAILAVDDLMERLAEGEWGTRREASELAGASILLRAIVEVTGKSVADIKAYLKSKTPAQKFALAGAEMFAPVVKRLQAEKAAKNHDKAVDTKALLGEIAQL